MNFPGPRRFYPGAGHLRLFMVLWIGVDDTDSLRGMCTTFLATEFVRELTRDLDLIGYPRLVRLNPNIPWKTRGNGAVCIRLGRGRGEPGTIGEIDGAPVRAYPSGERAGTPEAVLERAAEVLEKWAVFDDPTTNPGLVVLEHRPPPSLYWRAVRDIVRLEDTLGILHGRGVWKGYKNRRGLIGAAAATAWRPRDRTHELLAYRRPTLWGTPRRLATSSVFEMDARFPSTFNNVDVRTGRVAIAPHSPCPVLYGIRGDVAADLPAALQVLQGESPSRWFVVESNQGTDDHIVPDDWTLRPCTSISVAVTVLEEPRTEVGGHVFVRARGRSELDLAFYEPSKTFRNVARALVPGDRLRAWGSVRDDRRSLNVEKVKLEYLAPWRIRVANPICPACGKSMKSIGRLKGFRCVRGHGHAPSGGGSWIEVARPIQLGWYEPPVFARRHLAKPVQRLAVTEMHPQRPSGSFPQTGVSAPAPRRTRARGSAWSSRCR